MMFLLAFYASGFNEFLSGIRFCSQKINDFVFIVGENLEMEVECYFSVVNLSSLIFLVRQPIFNFILLLMDCIEFNLNK